MSSTANMYRVGDYVYFEINTASPYQIRRIEELNKTPSGNVEAKVMCFYRRRDIGQALLKVIDDRASSQTDAQVDNSDGTKTGSTEATPTEDEAVPDKETKSESAELKPESNDTKEEPPTSPKSADETEEPKSTEPKDSEPPTETASTPEKNESSDKADQDVVVKEEKPLPGATSAGVAMPGEEKLNDDEKHRLLHRELFLSRQIETLPATHIRGKCTVTLLNELETPDSYLNKDDAFFYSLVYDPAQKTILADKGEIRVGDKYQCIVPEGVLSEEERKSDRANASEYESLIFHPYHNLTDRQIDQYLILARSVGTLARAFDMNSATKYAGLHTTVSAASRDVTIFQAMILLHQAEYDMGKATSFLVPPAQKQWYPTEADKLAGHTTAMLGGPLMCRDQMEEWSAAESNLFEEALEKYGKDFNDIRQDFLPWKSLKDIIEYYYMWKTTDRYIQQKRVKAAEAESRLKQVYIPTYAKPNPNAINSNNTANFKRSCEGCLGDNSEQWYAWGPMSSQLRLCKECWHYWKKYGGLKKKHNLENFDKQGSQPQDTTQGTMMPRPEDRLVNMPDFGGRVQRCGLPGCSMQFASLQMLNQHMRRDHGIPLSGHDAMHNLLKPGVAAALANAAAQAAAAGASPLQFTGMHTGPTRNGPRTRAPVFLRTTLYTKSARRLAPKQLHNPRHAARNPFEPINAQAIRAYCQTQPQQKVQKMARVLVKMGLASASAQAAAVLHVQKQQIHPHGATTSKPSSGAPKSVHPNVATVAPIQRHHQQQLPQKRPAPGSGQPPTKRVRDSHQQPTQSEVRALIDTSIKKHSHAA